MKLSSDFLLSDDSKNNNKINGPPYDRSQLVGGILHIGVGNFHRAHQASYMDDLLRLSCSDDSSNAKNWAIVGAGVMPVDVEKRDCLQKQDWLTTVVERSSGNNKMRIVGSMIDFVPVEPPHHLPLQAALSFNPNIKIVSLTLTEGGYYLDSNTGAFDPTNTAIKHDAENPDTPQTVFGLIVKALKTRRDSSADSDSDKVKIDPFTVMSCDNIPCNGDVAKGVVVGLAKLQDPALADWIEANVGFPNSMVDRITPMTGAAERQFVQDTYGYTDAWPVCCEPFKQWVLEDDFFRGGRPQLERVGVQFVKDVKPYELMKIRILNGAHAMLCYAAALLDVEFVHDAMQHPVIGAFLDCVQRTEVIPSVPPVPDGTDLVEYWKLIQARFANPMIADTIDRICFDGANRQPKFIVPPIKDNLRDGRSVEGLALVSALWCRYCRGTSDSGRVIPPQPNDPLWDQLHQTALEAAADPAVWLGMSHVYGPVGKHDNAFVKSFSTALRAIDKFGAKKAMQHYVDKTTSSSISNGSATTL